MAISKSDSEKKLPFLTLESKIIGTRELQKISSSSLSSSLEQGPQIVSIGGIKRAVLVNYNQYSRFQETFKDLFKKMLIVNQILPKIPDGHKLHIEELKLEITGTLEKIVSESPETSPFAELMDAILGVATGLFKHGVQSTPSEIRTSARKTLHSTAQKVTKKHGRPKRNFTE